MTISDAVRNLCTVPEVSRLLGVPEREVRRAIQDGKLRALRWSPRRTYVGPLEAAHWHDTVWALDKG